MSLHVEYLEKSGHQPMLEYRALFNFLPNNIQNKLFLSLMIILVLSNNMVVAKHFRITQGVHFFKLELVEFFQ